MFWFWPLSVFRVKCQIVSLAGMGEAARSTLAGAHQAQRTALPDCNPQAGQKNDGVTPNCIFPRFESLARARRVRSIAHTHSARNERMRCAHAYPLLVHVEHPRHSSLLLALELGELIHGGGSEDAPCSKSDRMTQKDPFSAARSLPLHYQKRAPILAADANEALLVSSEAEGCG